MTSKNLGTRRALKRALSVFALGSVLAVGNTASALDINDILNMQAIGLDAGTIVNVIRAETAPLEIAPEEVDQLRIAGVPQPVLDEICLRVQCAAGPGGAAGPAGPIGPGGIGGPSLQEDLERQRRLEEERQRLELERLEAEREAMRQQIEAEQARQREIANAVVQLDEADDAFERGRCTQAATLYRDFMTRLQPSPGSVEHYRAIAGFTAAMYCDGYRHTIRREALQAVLYGPTSARFEEMFDILREISNEVRFLDPQIENLTGFSVNQYSERFQNEWHYFLGRFFWQYGDIDRALTLLERIPQGTSRYGQARYLSGVMLLEDGRNAAAYGAFQDAVIAEAGEEGDTDIFELGNLAIARIAFEIQEYDVALYHYNRVADLSNRHVRARYEMSWSYLLKADWDRAVGALHTMHSPYYETSFWPELWVLEAFIYLRTCQLELAQETVYDHDRYVGALTEPVQQFIVETAGPEQYYQAIDTYYARFGTNNPVNLPLEAVRFVLGDITFVKQRERIDALRAEQELLQSMAAELGDFASNAEVALNADIQTAVIEAGLRVAALVQEFQDELEDWNVKAQELEIEITTERLMLQEVTLEGGVTESSASTSLFVLAQDWQAWPFEGEYWIDEVDNYRGALTNLRDESQNVCMVPRSEEDAEEEINE